MTTDLRRCTSDEFGRYLRVCESAFGRGVTEEDIARWGQVIDPVRLLGAFDGETLVGTAGACSLTVTVPGGTAAAAGVTMVGLLPSHRRRGIFKRLMHELLSDARNNAESLAILWAAEGGIYQQFGFGLGSKNAKVDIETAKAVFRVGIDPVGRKRLIALEDALGVLTPIYDRVRAETPECSCVRRSGGTPIAYESGA